MSAHCVLSTTLPFVCIRKHWKAFGWIDSLCCAAHRGRTMTLRCLLFVLLAALLALPVGAQAQLYKWVDEDGGINYGDTPPPKAKNVRPVSQGSVSVVPGVSKDQMASMRKRDDQRRLEREQREADEARAAEKARAAAPPEPQYADSYVPDYGYWPTRPRPPDIGKNRPRPDPPSAKPLPAEPPSMGQPNILRGR
jgi:hypothetical protein